MMRMKKVSLLAVLVLFVVWAFSVTTCAAQGKPVKSSCQADIEWQITPEAEIIQFDCAVGAFKKIPSLIFTVGIKNVSDKPLRYRLNIFLLDMDKGAGHLMPAKGKPPVVEPGKTLTVKVPFMKTTDMSKKILVVVKTLGL